MHERGKTLNSYPNYPTDINSVDTLYTYLCAYFIIFRKYKQYNFYDWTIDKKPINHLNVLRSQMWCKSCVSIFNLIAYGCWHSHTHILTLVIQSGLSTSFKLHSPNFEHINQAHATDVGPNMDMKSFVLSIESIWNTLLPKNRCVAHLDNVVSKNFVGLIVDRCFERIWWGFFVVNQFCVK